MSITYEEALSTLEAMFGAPWTRDTLDAVLRHEKGHMENTCDRILNHGSGSPQSLLDKLAANGGDTTTTTLNADEELARSIQQQEQRRSMPTATSTSSTSAAAAAATTVPSQKKKQRGTPTNLPKDFLRIPGYPHPSLAAERKSSAAVDDETLARMLQDELFSQELARNPDFAHLARGRSSAGNGRFPARRTSSAGTAGAAAGTQEEGPKIIEKLSEMGDTARKRLAIFAAQFEQRMKNVNNNNNNNNRPNAFQNIFKGATGGGGGSGGGGLSAMAPFNNSTAAAAERRGLLDDDDDQDVIEFEMRKNK